MTWSSRIDRQLQVAIGRDDVKQFVALGRKHPENIARREHGAPTFLWRAAIRGQFEIVKFLVEEGGCDVNEPTGFGGPEGPIGSAAAEGHLRVVRWLLDHGAQLNYTVDGQERCFALTDAAIHGHMKIVKLLIERGANIHASWRGMNALMFAEMYGQQKVADYLRSLGAQDIRDITPPDYPAAHEAIRERHATSPKRIGHRLMRSPGDPAIEIWVNDPPKKDKTKMIYTVGVSDRDLPLPDGQLICTELHMILPRDWPLDRQSLRRAQYNWPVQWLRFLARDALDHNWWPGDEWAALMNDDPPRPLVRGTKMTGFLALVSQTLAGGMQLPDYRWVEFRTLFPVHTSEVEFVEQHGHEKLVKRFRDNNVPMEVTPDRPPL